jgi:hypothetical protein
VDRFKFFRKFAEIYASQGVPLSTGINDTSGKFATGVNDAGSKFAAGVNDADGKLPPVSTIPAAMVYSGAWGKLIYEKNRSRNSRDTVPLMFELLHYSKMLR